MLTREMRNTLYLGLILLVLLVLAGFTPVLTGQYATAAENGNSVDIITDEVNFEEEENAENQDEEDITSSDKEKKSDKKAEKKEKKSKKGSSESEESNASDQDEEINDETVDAEDADIDTSEDTDDESSGSKEKVKSEDNNKGTAEEDEEEADDPDEDEDDPVQDADDSDTEEMKASSEDSDENDFDENDEEANSIVEDADIDADLAAASEDDYGEADEDEEAVDVEQDPDEQDTEKKDNKDKKDKSDQDDDEGETENAVSGEFPASYASKLSQLQADHPNWTFVAADTGVTWEDALDAEDAGSKNLVDPSVDSSQRENSSKRYDGRWYLANRKTIAHYMDPRNFLNESDIYQFLVQSYEEGAQNTDTVADVIDGSFMEGDNPGGKYDSFEECINAAGAEAGVNPNVLAAMIIMEQGWKGSSLVSGKKDGYKGYYNFFNIGAWTTSNMSSTERGLWYAKGEGKSNKSYGRPWTSPYKAIVGGAEFYKENYINNNQNTYYTKKYNVMNGAGSIGDHQYMTNVSGALDEGKLVKRAYQDNSGLNLTFEIPVYQNMPKKVCKLP